MVKHWLVSQFIAEVEYDGAPRVIWEFAGIFSTKEAAIMACRDKYYAVSEVTLNQTVPHERHPFPHCWYPLIEEEPVR